MESNVNVILPQEDIDRVMDTKVLTINGTQFLRKDYVASLLIQYHKEHSLWWRLKKVIKKLNRK